VKDIVKSTFILGVSAVAAVASMLLDPCPARTMESEQVTFNSSERIRGIRMAGRTRPETKKGSLPVPWSMENTMANRTLCFQLT
jgi:hypothetical protein